MDSQEKRSSGASSVSIDLEELEKLDSEPPANVVPHTTSLTFK
jgi:hypothetical protein